MCSRSSLELSEYHYFIPIKKNTSGINPVLLLERKFNNLKKIRQPVIFSGSLEVVSVRGPRDSSASFVLIQMMLRDEA